MVLGVVRVERAKLIFVRACMVGQKSKQWSKSMDHTVVAKVFSSLTMVPRSLQLVHLPVGSVVVGVLEHKAVGPLNLSNQSSCYGGSFPLSSLTPWLSLLAYHVYGHAPCYECCDRNVRYRNLPHGSIDSFAISNTLSLLLLTAPHSSDKLKEQRPSSAQQQRRGHKRKVGQMDGQTSLIFLLFTIHE